MGRQTHTYTYTNTHIHTRTHARAWRARIIDEYNSDESDGDDKADAGVDDSGDDNGAAGNGNRTMRVYANQVPMRRGTSGEIVPAIPGRGDR